MWKRLDESIALSEKLASLSWIGLGTWTYLLSQTDTMGRFHRDSRIVKAKCMTMRYEIRPETVEEALLEIEKAGLLHCYAAEDGRQYLVLHNYMEFNPPGALGRVSPKYPAPPHGICPCVDAERRKEGVPAGVSSTLFSAEKSVRTPDVTSSPVLSTSSPEGVQGEVEPPDSPDSRLFKLAKKSKIRAIGDHQLRNYVAGWREAKGYQFVEALLMGGKVNGWDVLDVNKHHFREIGPPKVLKRKVPRQDCEKCEGRGRRLNPVTQKDMDCNCVREVAV